MEPRSAAVDQRSTLKSAATLACFRAVREQIRKTKRLPATVHDNSAFQTLHVSDAVFRLELSGSAQITRQALASWTIITATLWLLIRCEAAR